MSQILRFGLEVQAMTLPIPANSQFTRTMTLKDKLTHAEIDWGVGTTLTMIFDNGQADLVAVIAGGGPDAVFTFTTAISNAVPAGTGVVIQYANGSDNYPVWEGTVSK